jgi:hypothetical protein
MNIAKPFLNAWDIYIKNFGTIIISLIIVIILSIVTLGILAIPLFVGFQMLFVKAMRKKKIVANEVLEPIGRYWSILFGNVTIMIMVIFGFMLLIVPGFAWMAWWMYAILFIYDRNMHIEDGLRASKELVRKNGTWWHLLFLVVIGFINIALAQIFAAANIPAWIYQLLATIFVTPITSGAIACAYADESKGK